MIGTKLKMLRTKKGYTVAQICSEMGLNTSSYIKYERDERELSVATLSKFADFYGVSTDYLLDRNPDDLTPDQIEEYIRLRNLDPIEERLIRGYIALPEKARANVVAFLKRMIEEKENK